MSDKICLNCRQEWSDCICVIPIKRDTKMRRPTPHLVLSMQLRGPTIIRLGQPLGADPPKEFCPDCSQRWRGCRCAGRRI